MDFGEKLKELRLAQNLTLEEVGKRVGVAKSTVRKWEHGYIKNMRRDKVALVAKALGVTPAYLFGWDESADSAPVPTVSDDRRILIESITELLADLPTAKLESLLQSLRVLLDSDS